MNVFDQLAEMQGRFLRPMLEFRPLRRYPLKRLSPAFFVPARPSYGPLPPDFQQQAGRFLIVGFPKSGNVWFRSLIASCLDLPVDNQGGRCFVEHTHQPFHSRYLFDRKLLRGVVLLRDLRDVIVSLYHFTHSDHFKRFHGEHHVFKDANSMYTDYFLPYFVNRVSVLESLPDAFVYYGWPVVRYEHLRESPKHELKRLFQVWGIDVSEEKIDAAIDANSLESMRKGKGKVTAEVQTSHFRKGTVGGYEADLEPHIIADIEHRFGDYLSRWGYRI